jgi:hypothetical protein
MDAYICKWCFESLTISFCIQGLQSHQSILIFYTLCPYKTQFSPPHSHMHEPLAPPLPPRTSSASLLLVLASHGCLPVLPLVSCSTWDSSSLPGGGELPCQGSTTWAAQSPRAGLPYWICRPHPLLEGGGGDTPPTLASLLQSLEGGGGDAARCKDDMEAIRFTLVSFYFSTYILIKHFM